MSDDFDHPWDADTLHEECGVFGIFDQADAGALAVLGLQSAPVREPESSSTACCESAGRLGAP